MSRRFTKFSSKDRRRQGLRRRGHRRFCEAAAMVGRSNTGAAPAEHRPWRHPAPRQTAARLHSARRRSPPGAPASPSPRVPSPRRNPLRRARSCCSPSETCCHPLRHPHRRTPRLARQRQKFFLTGVRTRPARIAFCSVFSFTFSCSATVATSAPSARRSSARTITASINTAGPRVTRAL
jgi:hypothetical protein